MGALAARGECGIRGLTEWEAWLPSGLGFALKEGGGQQKLVKKTGSG